MGRKKKSKQKRSGLTNPVDVSGTSSPDGVSSAHGLSATAVKGTYVMEVF